MKSKLLFALLLFVSLKSFSQIENLNNKNELIKFQNNITSSSKTAVVWGYFNSWGKYSGIDKFACKGVLNKDVYSKITTCLSFTLFSDTTAYYLPIREPNSISVQYKPNDIIKLKIRLYKNCKTVDNKTFFLIEEIL